MYMKYFKRAFQGTREFTGVVTGNSGLETSTYLSVNRCEWTCGAKSKLTIQVARMNVRDEERKHLNELLTIEYSTRLWSESYHKWINIIYTYLCLTTVDSCSDLQFTNIFTLHTLQSSRTINTLLRDELSYQTLCRTRKCELISCICVDL